MTLSKHIDEPMHSPGSSSSVNADILTYHLLRANFASFLEMAFGVLKPGDQYQSNWHILAIAHHLERVRLGKIKRLIITMPPRSLKSIAASVAFPAFVLGHDPTREIIAASYSQELATKHHNDFRMLVNSALYRLLFPNTRVSATKDSESEVVMTARGNRIAASVGGTLTGRGGDIIIIDDPLKPADAMSEPKRSAVNEWFRSTVMSRLNSKQHGAIVIVTQRLHADDLVGNLLEQSAADWTVLNLPAIASEPESIPIAEDRVHKRNVGEVLHPARESAETLERIRREIGSDAFAAQYQQSPAPPGGAMFKRSWFRYYDRLPDLTDEDPSIIQSWDTASKTGPINDWSVCTTWLLYKNRYYLIDVFRDKLDFPSLKQTAIDLGHRHRVDTILVEDTGVGTGLISELWDAGYNTQEVNPTTSKEARASVQSAKIQGGRVLFPSNAPWLREFEAELLAFPGSRHDDQVDSMVQALDHDPAGEFHIEVVSF